MTSAPRSPFPAAITAFLRLTTGALDIVNLLKVPDQSSPDVHRALLLQQTKYLDSNQRKTFFAAVKMNGYLMMIAAMSAEDPEIDAMQKAGEELTKFGYSVPDVTGVKIQWSGSSGSIRVEDPEVGAALYYFQIYMHDRFDRDGRRSPVLLESLLITLTSSFEYNLRRLFRSLAELYPGMFGSSEHAFTLNELMKFNTIDEARHILIERKIDSLMAEGIEGWEKRLEKSDIGITVRTTVQDWNSVREIFARRNIFVHNESKVNHRYLAILNNLRISWSEQPNLGATLTVSPEYFSRSTEVLTDAALNLTIACWIKAEKGSGESVAQWLCHIQYVLFDLKCWAIIIHSANFVMSNALLSRAQHVRLQILAWTAARRSGKDARDMVDLLEWDTTGLNLKLAHAKDVLLGDHKRAISSIKQLLHTGNLRRAELHNEPLYFELREMGLLSNLIDLSEEAD